MSDIVSELRERKLLEEIERLRAEKAADWAAACESARLASAEITRLRLTDAEREAVEAAVAEFAGLADEHDSPRDAARAATLRGLLDRTK